MHAEAQEDVREGITALGSDIRKWDDTLFEPRNFDLALCEKAQADQEKAARLENLKQMLDDPEINLENCEKNAAKHYEEKLQSLQALCKKHKTKFDLLKMMKKRQRGKEKPSDTDLFQMLLELENPYMHIKKNGSLKNTYLFFNLLPKEKSLEDQRLQRCVRRVKKDQKRLEDKMLEEKRYREYIGIKARI